MPGWGMDASWNAGGMMPTNGQNVPMRRGSYGARASAPMDPMSYMINSYQSAWDQARNANEQRYRDILGGWRSMGSKAMGLAGSLGQSRMGDINRQFNALRGSSMQDLTSRGLGNSTIRPSINAGIERQRGYALTNAADAATQQQLGVLGGMGREMLGFAERREDEYPDYNQLEKLAGEMGQYGARGPTFMNAGAFGYGMGNLPPFGRL